MNWEAVLEVACGPRAENVGAATRSSMGSPPNSADQLLYGGSGNGEASYMDRAAIEADIANVHRIAAVPRILTAVVELTGMRFAAVARVTDTTWTTCAAQDDLGFGLAPGADLPLETTLCNEIRQHHQPILFSQASTHPVYCDHHTPKHYGLESYLSVPIFRRNGEFFGTLCAIDTRPASLDGPNILRTAELFAELIGLQLEVAEDLGATRVLLHEAEERERVGAAAEHDIRDLFQPIVTGLYLLRSSPSLGEDDLAAVRQVEDSCNEVVHLLHKKFNDPRGRINEG